jgi:hypothetical protein
VGAFGPLDRSDLDVGDAEDLVGLVGLPPGEATMPARASAWSCLLR